jgi:hypothetical protein
MGSPEAIITMGYGSWGSIGDTVTLGYGSGDEDTSITGTWSNVIHAHTGGRIEAHTGGRIEAKTGGRIEAHA